MECCDKMLSTTAGVSSDTNLSKPVLYTCTSSTIISSSSPSQTMLNKSPASSENTTSNNNLPQASTAVIVMSPCAACKILRRRCVEKCVLAPYFPPTDPLKFTIAHRVFGASNIIKLLQELPESQRADAVSSMVYEANARVRDPVYGCAGAICHLQKQVSELQAELAKAQAEMLNMQCQQANLLTQICRDLSSQNNNNNNHQAHNHQQYSMVFDDHDQQLYENLHFFPDLDVSIMEPLWT